MGKTNRKLRKWRNYFNRRMLRNRDFSVICNNCLAGMILHDLGLPFLSPTINLFFHSDDFIRFLSDLEGYLSMELVFSDEDEQEIGYPVGMLGDVKIFFLHYESRKEAFESWNRRKERINFQNLFILFSLQEGCPAEILEAFDRLPYKNKAALINQPCPQIGSAWYIRGFESNEKNVKFYSYRGKLTGRKYYDQFPYVRWFNGKYAKKDDR